MVAPGVVAHDMLSSSSLWAAAPGMSSAARIAAFERGGQLAREADALDDRVEIPSRLVVGIVEVAEVDQRRLARVRGAQRDPPARLRVCAFRIAQVR